LTIKELGSLIETHLVYQSLMRQSPSLLKDRWLSPWNHSATPLPFSLSPAPFTSSSSLNQLTIASLFGGFTGLSLTDEHAEEGSGLPKEGKRFVLEFTRVNPIFDTNMLS